MSDKEQDIVKELYALVAEPHRYDAFMYDLSQRLESLKEDHDETDHAALLTHIDHASSLVDIVTPWRYAIDDDLREILDRKIHAAMAINTAGEIIDANSSAKYLYDLQSGQYANELPLSGPSETGFPDIVRQAFPDHYKRNNPNNIFRFTDTRSGKPVLVTTETYESMATQAQVVIVQTSDFAWPAYLGPILKDLFSLTQAEIDILQLVVEGFKVSEIRTRRGASEATVRSQLSAIFQKTGVGSQVECIRMVMGLSMLHDANQGRAIASELEASQGPSYFPRSHQRRVLTLENKRTIEYSVFGAKDGDVLLFYHCQVFGDSWFQGAVDAAHRAGLQIIAPLRPGFGQTTVYSGKYSDPHIFAADIEALLDHLNVNRASILSVSSGLVHALAAVHRMPGRFTGISATHPILPVLTTEDLEGTNGYNYLIPHARLRFPPALKLMCRAGFAFVQTAGVAAFLRALLRSAPKDVEWAMRPDVFPVLEWGTGIHANQGYVGNLGDISYSENWLTPLTECSVPIRLVIGEHDRNVPWAAAKRHAKEQDHISLHILQDSGYLVHHQQGRQLVRWAAAELADEPIAFEG